MEMKINIMATLVYLRGSTVGGGSVGMYTSMLMLYNTFDHSVTTELMQAIELALVPDIGWLA